MSAARREWPQIVARAAEIVRGYDTPVTLRQLFYRLVSAQVIPNTQSAYSMLSSKTAQARRDGGFPALLDRGRAIHRTECFDDVNDAFRSLQAWYRLDRTEGQEVSLYLGVEKAGLVNQLTAWFGDLGVPVLALGGYSSQTYVDDVVADVQTQRRPAVLLYAGDFDPSGEDIDRDFVARTACFDKVERIALSREQVDTYRLPPNPGKMTDTRAAKFIERHGELMQVEIDAVDPVTLRALFTDAISTYWDDDAHRQVLQREDHDLERIDAVVRDAR